MVQYIHILQHLYPESGVLEPLCSGCGVPLHSSTVYCNLRAVYWSLYVLVAVYWNMNR